jgi:hypothetical protein
MSGSSVISPRNNNVKLVSNPNRKPKSMFSRTSIDNSSVKSSQSESEIIKPVLTRSRKKLNPPPTPKTLGEVDLLFNQMNLTVLFTLIVDEPEFVIAMTPIGTIIAIKLDTNKNINTDEEKIIKIKPSKGNKGVKGSYLSSISKNLDFRSLSVCSTGVCVLSKDNMGKIVSNNYNINSLDNLLIDNKANSYPLVLMSELLEGYETNYVDFLLDLRSQSTDKKATLTRDIEFIENLLTNMKNIQSKITEFESANKEEFKLYSDRATELLRKGETDPDVLSKLYLLNSNKSFLNNGVNKFNTFRDCLYSMEQEAYSYYFSLYGRVAKTIDSSSHMEIRKPSNWSLSSVLPETELLFSEEDSNLTSTELVRSIRSDMSKYSFKNNEEDTNLLMRTLESNFF